MIYYLFFQLTLKLFLVANVKFIAFANCTMSTKVIKNSNFYLRLGDVSHISVAYFSFCNFETLSQEENG